MEYGRSDGQSITGGYVQRGSQPESLAGLYIYGDFVSGKIWGLRHDGSQLTEHVLLADSGLAISTFGQDDEGNVYIGSRSDGIYRLAEK